MFCVGMMLSGPGSGFGCLFLSRIVVLAAERCAFLGEAGYCGKDSRDCARGLERVRFGEEEASRKACLARSGCYGDWLSNTDRA